MQIPQLDWKVASIALLAALTVYNVLVKLYTTELSTGREDIRSFYPVIIVIGLVALALFLYNGQGAKMTEKTPLWIFVILVLLGATYYLTLVAFNGPLSVVVPIIGLSAAASAVIAVLFLGETFTIAKGAGVLLGLASIYLLLKG
ncbi:Uncharacterised protein [Candidatus Gugararchaeum adminiculabundum]|nr:Uncharacterised protein [Candidatus Gugararchaeum adminiculabundum]